MEKLPKCDTYFSIEFGKTHFYVWNMFCCWLILSYWVIFSYWLLTWSCPKCRWEISFLNAGSEENLTLVVNIFLQPTVYSRPQKVQSISLRGQAKAIWAWIVWKPIYHKQPCAIISSNTSQYLLLYLQRPSKKWKCVCCIV